MTDVLLFLDGVMKIALVVGVMILVATAPSQAHATSHGQRAAAAHATQDDEEDKPSRSRRMLDADDDRWLEDDDASPSMNLDGAPMAGDLDIHGNFLGDCGSACDSWD